jgi:hypothetical protein
VCSEIIGQQQNKEIKKKRKSRRERKEGNKERKKERTKEMQESKARKMDRKENKKKIELQCEHLEIKLQKAKCGQVSSAIRKRSNRGRK